MEGGFSNVAVRAVLARKISREFGEMSSTEVKFMTDVCTRDFINFVGVEKGFLYDLAPDERVALYFEELVEYKPTVFASMIEEWFGLWTVKWRQRVKLGERSDIDEKLLRMVEERARPFMDLPVVREARLFALGSLIKSGEVCFTVLLSSTVVRDSLYCIASRASSPNEVRGAIERNPALLLNEIVKRVRAMAKFRGPLVTLKLERIAFNEGGAWLA